MSSIYGFTITTAGRNLLAKLLAGEILEITRAMVGVGKVPEGRNPAELLDLVQPLAKATATAPVIRDTTITFCVEYRSDLNGGLSEGKYINEFGIFARDPEKGEILLYYGTLGDYPQYIPPYNPNSVGILRYPVTITLANDVEMILTFDTSAFVTFDDIADYIQITAIPELLEVSRNLINLHDTSEESHQSLKNFMVQLSSRINRLEDMMLNNVTGNTWSVNFNDITGLNVEGVWNKTQSRIEF